MQKTWYKHIGFYYALLCVLIAVLLACEIGRVSTNRDAFIRSVASKALFKALQISAKEASPDSYSHSSKDYNLVEPTYYSKNTGINLNAPSSWKNAENLEINFLSLLNDTKGMPPFLVTNVHITTAGNRLSYGATIVYPGLFGNRTVYFDGGPLIPQKKLSRTK